MVDDYEGRRLVVDNICEHLIEFMGYCNGNETFVPAAVLASRTALEPFLQGGNNNNHTSTSLLQQRLVDIQTRREQAARRPVHFEDTAGVEEGDETGIFAHVLDREVADWGRYTATGAQLAATQQVAGVLLLSDVYGAFGHATTALARKIAFECQPVVVMVPDLFGGNPWCERSSSSSSNDTTYEEWRATHSDAVVHFNIRAAAACLRERYGVSSVVVWGTCYGGGRALEVASGWLPPEEENNANILDGRVGPPMVDPLAVIAWYPTRYNAAQLFGPTHRGTRRTAEGKERKMAVMGVFAGNDVIPGATPECAAELKSLLEVDERVKDHMVKVFPGQDHGFAHAMLGQDEEDGWKDETERFLDEEFGGAGKLSIADGDAEVACLLSTAFMETYSRTFLPTVGPPISLDDKEAQWGKTLEMKDLEKTNQRNVRQEIEEAVDGFVEEPLGGYRIDPTDESQDDELARLLRTMEDPDMKDGPNKIQPEDDLTTIYAKLTSSSDDFQLF